MTGNTEDDIATEAELSRNIRFGREYLAGLSDLRTAEIRELHRILFTTRARSPKRPGQYRTGGGIANFGRDQGPAGHLVDHEMETFLLETQLLRDLAESLPSKERPDFNLLAVTYLHARLVWIHPFGDGNGRVSRLVAEFQGRQFFADPGISWFSASARGDLMSGYNDALSISGHSNDLAPLARVFAESANRTIPSPVSSVPAPFEIICEKRILGPSHKIPPYDFPSYLTRRLNPESPFAKTLSERIGALPKEGT